MIYKFFHKCTMAALGHHTAHLDMNIETMKLINYLNLKVICFH